MKQREPVITIDGAGGTGKGCVSQLVAKKLGWRFLDSGALYRVLALAAEKHGVSFENESALQVLAEYVDVQFVADDAEAPRVLLEGQDVSDTIRTERVGNCASKVATLPGVRQALLSRQRAFQTPHGLIADGRDMGTVVFPHAELKIFLTASLEKRAERRYKQLKEKNIHANLSDLINELQMRDKRDQERAVAPLKPAEDAICIDTDFLSVEDVVNRVLAEVKVVFPSKLLSSERN